MSRRLRLARTEWPSTTGNPSGGAGGTRRPRSKRLSPGPQRHYPTVPRRRAPTTINPRRAVVRGTPRLPTRTDSGDTGRVGMLPRRGRRPAAPLLVVPAPGERLQQLREQQGNQGEVRAVGDRTPASATQTVRRPVRRGTSACRGTGPARQRAETRTCARVVRGVVVLVQHRSSTARRGCPHLGGARTPGLAPITPGVMRGRASAGPPTAPHRSTVLRTPAVFGGRVCGPHPRLDGGLCECASTVSEGVRRMGVRHVPAPHTLPSSAQPTEPEAPATGPERKRAVPSPVASCVRCEHCSAVPGQNRSELSERDPPSLGGDCSCAHGRSLPLPVR